MTSTFIGLLTIHLHLPGVTSLKEKRGHLKPLLIRLQREFNLSVSEVDFQDRWQEALIACAVVSNSQVFNQQILQKALEYLEANWPDLPVMDHHLEHL